MALRLIPNAREVAFNASSMWALYGVFFTDAGIKILELFILHSRDWTWKDFIVPVLSIVAMTCRLIQQERLKNATEQRLEAEKLARQRFEIEATSSAPPLTPVEAEAIKQDAREKAAGPTARTSAYDE